MPAKRLIPVLDVTSGREAVLERALALAGQGADELALRGEGLAEDPQWMEGLGVLPLARVAWASSADAAAQLLAWGAERVVVELAAMAPHLEATVRVGWEASTWTERYTGAREVMLEGGLLGPADLDAWRGHGLPLAYHWRGGDLARLVDLLASGLDAVYLDGPVNGLEGGLPALRGHLREAGVLVRLV